MQAAPLIVGNDVRTMAPEASRILLNRDVIAVDQDTLGNQGRSVSKQGAVEIWIKLPLDGAAAVALFNRSAKAELLKLS
jgi:alpha-galactosidase